jgi:hypothetical protein
LQVLQVRNSSREKEKTCKHSSVLYVFTFFA